MYRQNNLRKEIDNLRKEIDTLKEENFKFRTGIIFWKERCNTLNAEVRALRYELQNRDLMGRLITKETLEPRIIKLDDEVKE